MTVGLVIISSLVMAIIWVLIAKQVYREKN